MTIEMSSQRASEITGARNWAQVEQRHPGPVGLMADGLMAGDRAADDLIVAMYRPDAGFTWSDVIRALDDPRLDPGRDLSAAPAVPQALGDFLDVVSTPPPWFDPALARAGAKAWWRFGSLQSSTLYQSLIYGYQARGFIRPLIATGRLTDGTWDRVQATARWVTLATAPDMMAPGASGWSETVRIRLVHAMVRHHLHTVPDPETGAIWDDASWGVPINQTYAQLTIAAGFLILPLRIARDFGIRYSPAELEAITHLWRWIGWVMGVEDERLPRSYDDARQIHAISREFRLHPDDESKTLVRALLDDGFRAGVGLPGPLDGAVHTVSKPFLRTLFAAVSTRWVDDEIASEMGLRANPLHHVVDLARPVVWSRELARTIGLLGSESSVVRRELRLVAGRLGIDLAAAEVLGDRYRDAHEGTLEPVA